MFDVIQQPQRLVIPRAGADRGIEPGHGLQIVVEHVGTSCGDGLGAGRLAQKIRGEDLNGRGRRGLSDGLDDGGKMRGPAIGKVVAIDRGDHHVPQS